MSRVEHGILARAGEARQSGGARVSALPWGFMPTIPVNALPLFGEGIRGAAGVRRHKAEVAAACLISANLRGVDSHGIQLLPFYVDSLLASEMDPLADGRVISETGSCLH